MEKDMGKYINVQPFRNESYSTLYFYIVLSLLNVHIDNPECNQTVYTLMQEITATGNCCDFDKLTVISCHSYLLLSLCTETINVRPTYT